MGKVSMSYLVSFRRYQAKWVLFLTVHDVINFKIYRGSSSKAMAHREKKRGRWKYKNLNIGERKELFR